MNQQTLLKNTLALARTGDREAFENLYILTVQETYAKACDALNDETDAEALLVDIYVQLFRRFHELPSSAERIGEEISGLMKRLVYKKMGLKIYEMDCDTDYYHLSGDRAATLWLWIEERSGGDGTPKKEKGPSPLKKAVNIGKILLAVFLLVLTGFLLYRGWGWINGNASARMQTEPETQAVTENVSTEIVIEEEMLKPGWEEKEDGNLYYVRKDGVLATGTIGIGKQMLSFSDEGKLTYIGASQAVSATPGLSFDENTRYEVKDGDIYTKELTGSSSETAVTQNGHVIQADARCGYLWYVCKYQVPNSQQVRTTIYRSGLDGEDQEEICTTDSTLKTEQFQISGDWMYYISDGMLLRRNLKSTGVELMAENVEYYFAWENKAYYMKDRELLTVSQGEAYTGTEAGYNIRLTESGFVLLDALGAEVQPDANGEIEAGDRIYKIENNVIASVSPAERTDNGITYYIDKTGTDGKIYSRSDSGAQSLIRQEGLSVDSMCIAGTWLYYSSRTGVFGGEPGSRIYRLNLETLEQEPVGNSFGGYMKNLYYFDNLQMILGEYIPTTSDPANLEGEIARIEIGKNPEAVDVSAALPENHGSCTMEIVMAEGDKLYCLYHEGSYITEAGDIGYTSTQPVVIDLN